jgi:hypothetical protein
VYLPPTLDQKKATHIKNQHAAENGDVESDRQFHDFNPEHMPNITKWKPTPVPQAEPWNEHAKFSVLSPPESKEEAMKSLNLLISTHAQRSDDYVDALLPSIDQPRHSEQEWWVSVVLRNVFTFLRPPLKKDL